MDNKHIFLEILDERWKTYGEELNNCRTEFSAAAVHDLRLATRRLLACIEMGRVLDPHTRLQIVRRTLKNQIDDLDDLRDVQVMLAETEETLPNLPELKPIQTYLQSAEKKLLRAARKQIKTFSLMGLNKRIFKIRDSLVKRLESSEAQAELLQALDNAFLTVTQRYGQIDAAQSATIHRLRLAFKKFRYMLEIIHPTLPNFPVENLERMHDYQAKMGEVHDVEMFLNLITEFSEQDASYDPQPARHYYEKIHADIISTYLDDKDELLIFWRSAPDQPYPWQSEQLNKKVQS